MRITITIDTDVKVDIPPVKPEVPLETKPDVPLPNDYYTRKYDPLPADYYTPNSNKPFITPVFSEYN
jgi:hypothetical protein